MPEHQTGNKIARPDGQVAAIVSHQPLPRMCRIRQKFDAYKIGDIAAELKSRLMRHSTLDRVKSGHRIAVTAGSRGISNIALITRTVIEEIKRMGGRPFIVPSMGSHGGATAQGQVEVLASYGITETTMECPILASMETRPIGFTDSGKAVHLATAALEADGIVVIGRIKPHTAFHGRIESGLLKMITIGLGKQYGADICHADGFLLMEQNVVSMALTAIKNCPILFGVALIENAYDETRRIEAIPAECILEEEPALLAEARRFMPSIMFKTIDVLIVDEIGKNISGDGMDPNITGTYCTPFSGGGTNQQRTVVLDLTAETHGNAMGLGLADFSVPRAFNKMDFEMTYPNALTTTALEPAKIPVIMANDKLAIQAAIKTCVNIDFNHPRVVRIQNSLKLGEIAISESLIPEARENPAIEILEKPTEFIFDSHNNLF